MKPTYNRSEIFALAHKYRKDSLLPGYKAKSFADCLRRAWAESRQTMNAIKSRMERGDVRDDYGSSYIVVTLPWSRYEEFRTGVGARKMVAMPPDLQRWMENYGAH